MAAARKGTPRFQLFLKKDQKTNFLMVEPGVKLRHAVAPHVSEDQYLATIGGRLLGLDRTVAELGLLSGGTLQVVERLRGGEGGGGRGGGSRLAREVLVDLCGMSMCLFQVSGNAMCVTRQGAGALATPATGGSCCPGSS